MDFSGHQPDHRPLYNSLSVRSFDFIVFNYPTMKGQPIKRAFDDPSLWHYPETFHAQDATNHSHSQLVSVVR